MDYLSGTSYKAALQRVTYFSCDIATHQALEIQITSNSTIVLRKEIFQMWVAKMHKMSVNGYNVERSRFFELRPVDGVALKRQRSYWASVRLD
jgi:hypothetical protein